MANLMRQSTFSSVRAWFRLIRGPNCIALGVLFICSSICYGGNQLTVRDCLKGLTWVVIAALAYTYNDIVDLEIDRQNNKSGPLVTGIVSTRGAQLGFFVLVGLSMI